MEGDQSIILTTPDMCRKMCPTFDVYKQEGSCSSVVGGWGGGQYRSITQEDPSKHVTVVRRIRHVLRAPADGASQVLRKHLCRRALSVTKMVNP